jgi:hypothetical protein
MGLNCSPFNDGAAAAAIVVELSQVDSRISIRLSQGSIRLQIPEQSVEMKPAALLTLGYGSPHDVEGVEESAILITISGPGQTNDKRHAPYLL